MWLNTFQFPYPQSEHGCVRKNDTYIKVGNTYRFNIEDVSDALTNKSKPLKDNDNIVRETWHHEDDVDKEHGIEKVNLDQDY